MRKSLLNLILMGLFATQLNAEHQKIEIMITNPRTVGNAFEKSMMARGDHKVFHEPWATPSLLNQPNTILSQELVEAKTYEGIKALIYRYAAEKPVFVKDIMAWTQNILTDEELMKDPQVVFSILLRNPAHSIESFFLKMMAIGSPEQAVQATKAFFRYDQLVELSEKHYALRMTWPIMIQAEELCADPQSTMHYYCLQADIPFIAEALSWQAGMPEEWKHREQYNFDTEACASTGFYIPKRDSIEGNFTQMPAEYVSALEEIYQAQKPFYEKLKTFTQ